MDYTLIGWKNDQPPAINAENLNKMDSGIKAASDEFENLREELTQRFNAVDDELSYKIDKIDLGGETPREANDSLVIKNQDMSLRKERKMFAWEEIYAAKDVVYPCVPCTITENQLKEELDAYDAENIKAFSFAIVNENFSALDWNDNLIPEKDSNIICKVYLSKTNDNYFVEAYTAESTKIWGISDLANGDVDIIGWLKVLNFPVNSLYIYFGEGTNYYMYEEEVSKIIIDSELRQKYYSKSQANSRFGSQLYNEMSGNLLKLDGISAYADKITIDASSNFCANGKNFFDKSTITVDEWLELDGTTSTASGYVTSDYICVNPGTHYYLQSRGTRRLKFYDKDKNVVTNTWDIGSAEAYALLIPEGVYFVRLSLASSLVENFQFEIAVKSGSTYNGTEYEIYKGGMYSADIKEIEPIYPVMYISSTEPLMCKYAWDINEAISKLKQSIIQLGGKI